MRSKTQHEFALKIEKILHPLLPQESKTLYPGETMVKEQNNERRLKRPNVHTIFLQGNR